MGYEPNRNNLRRIFVYRIMLRVCEHGLVTPGPSLNLGHSYFIIMCTRQHGKC